MHPSIILFELFFGSRDKYNHVPYRTPKEVKMAESCTIKTHTLALDTDTKVRKRSYLQQNDPSIGAYFTNYN